ncbi:regulator of volume decrease after cellular swelling-domain-containing protein [Xylariaceae sp. FL1272]|nr:regulator of volume decrease after cellular swelling-domain-containing protein [Xylariaceae sp. FL1272]
MLAQVVKACPSTDNDFQPLNEYQAQTPGTFFEGPPVLHYHDKSTKVWVAAQQADQLFIFSKPSADSSAATPTPPESHALDDATKDSTHEEKGVEVFVSSRKLVLFSHNTGTGVEIPYPAITLHAIKKFSHDAIDFIGVYMQLEFAGSDPDDDESFDPIELTLIPSHANTAGTESTTIDSLNSERANALFNQISACSNLNPDPHNEDEDDEDDEFGADHIIFESNVEPGIAIDGLPGVLQGSATGGLPPPMPGSSGWITADNVDQYFDQDGNWIGEEGVSGELGDGAGRVRGRDEAEQDGASGIEEGEDGDTKRPRTE